MYKKHKIISNQYPYNANAKNNAKAKKNIKQTISHFLASPLTKTVAIAATSLFIYNYAQADPSACYPSPSTNHCFLTGKQITRLKIFLITPVSLIPGKRVANKPGAAYTASAYGGVLPLSYYSTTAYWNKYVCKGSEGQAGTTCNVTDNYDSNAYTNTPTDPSSDPSKFQIERVDVWNGTNLYDQACWQIAMALVGKGTYVNTVNTYLKEAYDGNDNSRTANANKAIEKTYNNTKIDKANQAFFFRMVTQNWLSQDPLSSSPDVKISQQGQPPSQYTGKMTWMDWLPITGENAWAFLVGPIQAAKIPSTAFDTATAQPVVDNAFKAMQSASGGIYYLAGNDPTTTKPKWDISVENNASTLAGLLLYDKQTKGKDTTVKPLINGILNFLVNNAYDKKEGVFYSGGTQEPGGKFLPYANQDTTCDSDTRCSSMAEPHAVDVNTWTISVLGQPFLDNQKGFGTAYDIWQKVKKLGGYCTPDNSGNCDPSTPPTGVGYVLNIGLNNPPSMNPHTVISAEWTAGAINMVRGLITQYTAVESCTANKACGVGNYSYTQDNITDAKKYVASLTADEHAMLGDTTTGLLSLDSDNFVAAYNSVLPSDYASLIPMGPSTSSNERQKPKALAFEYANKRAPIPFGWNANPLPSTTSTSWAIMLHYGFDPFSANPWQANTGNYEANDWTDYTPTPPGTRTVTFKNYDSTQSDNIVLVQNGKPLSIDIPAATTATAPSTTTVKLGTQDPATMIDPAKPIDVQTNNTWNQVCKVKANTLQSGASFANNVPWGQSCNISTSSN